MKSLVIGGGGFIGTNLVKWLKEKGHEVTALDLHEPLFEKSAADHFLVADARMVVNLPDFSDFDRVYQLAADMGGAGFVFTGENDADLLTNSVSINSAVACRAKLSKFKGILFYSSSVCVYSPEAAAKTAYEEDAYPASADSNYGWEKLYSERLYEAYARNYGLNVRIARFNNTYGPQGVYEGGREKSPAAICRKVIDANPDVEIWGDGRQVREFVYIDDLLEAIEVIMGSSYQGPINIGPETSHSINEMVEFARQVEDKEININYVDGPIGLQVRLTGHAKIFDLGWRPRIHLPEGIRRTYLWIKEQKSK